MGLQFRSIWISDTHLGGKNLKSNKLYDFLNNTDSEYLYLVGDILDLWLLNKRWHWPEINDKIVELVFEKAQNDTEVFYLPGNHDAMMRKYVGSTFNGVHIRGEMIHQGANGDRFLVLHGDRFDRVVQENEWLAHIGSRLYEALLRINRNYNNYRKFMGKDYYSISALLKHKCKTAVSYMSDYEDALVEELHKQEVDGVICGHIHHATIKNIGDFLYTNSGDWVESCTALAENDHGAMGVIQWAEQNPVKECVLLQEENEKNRYSDGCLAPTN
jgi:UDP-2,3-diacylglucosamine pyrophosphatase LpxH